MENARNADLVLGLVAASVLLIEERARRDMVVGVPHHAPAGRGTLPCPEHPAADENAGFLGRYLADRLGCHSIVACCYPIDANKSWGTDYSSQLRRWAPKVLVEMHGHGRKKARSDVEISPGRKENDRFSRELAERIREGCSGDETLQELSVCGGLDEIYFKARGTVTISEGEWIAYHIELPPELRKAPQNATGTPPEVGYRFCDILARALRDMHPE